MAGTLQSTVRSIGLLTLAILIAGCGGDGEATEEPEPTATSAPSRTPTAEPTSPPQPTATPEPELGDPGEMAITRVYFGDQSGEGGLVDLRNVGSAPVDLARFKLCQPPECMVLDIDVLEPGKVLRVTSSDAVSIDDAEGILLWLPGSAFFSPNGGNFGLYSVDGEGQTIEIVSYVAWGAPDQPADDIAAANGVWVDDAFVDTRDAAEITAPADGTTDPADWFAWPAAG